MFIRPHQMWESAEKVGEGASTRRASQLKAEATGTCVQSKPKDRLYPHRASQSFELRMASVSGVHVLSSEIDALEWCGCRDTSFSFDETLTHFGQYGNNVRVVLTYSEI